MNKLFPLLSHRRRNPVALFLLAALIGCEGHQPLDAVELTPDQVSALEERRAQRAQPNEPAGSQEPVALAGQTYDLAAWDREQAWKRVLIDDGPTISPETASPFFHDALRISQPFYWKTKAGTTVEVDLAEPCYVSSVVVVPLGSGLGVGQFSVQYRDERGELRDFHPSAIASALAESTANPIGEAAQAHFFPRLTQRVRIAFRDGGPKDKDNLYIQQIRVLGRKQHAPAWAPPADLSEEETQRLASAPRNLAELAPADINKLVRPSETRLPNGHIQAAFTATPELGEYDGPPPLYWGARAPSYVTVDLGRECIVNQIRVKPYNAQSGVGSFYAKVLQDGYELDTSPPAEARHANPSEDWLVANFEPVRATALRLYFPAGGGEPDWTYVRKIEINGIPVNE